VGPDALWFSDPNENLVWSWSPDAGLAPVRLHSGHRGADIARYGQPGSNGLAFDAQNRRTAIGRAAYGSGGSPAGRSVVRRDLGRSRARAGGAART
jgi:hypothetical protein